jgi:methionyl-tRNA formyltransferase
LSTPRIVFAGTPEFALASLQALVEAGHDVVAVYTQPDRPAGRGRQLTASPVKRYAEDREIAVLQPHSMKDEAVVAELGALCPDVMVVAAYGLLLPEAVLDVPTHGCLNVHASLLPRWRGAAPIQAAILADDKRTGISLMDMTVGLDCGAVFSTAELEIGSEECAGELHDRLAHLGGELLVRDLQKILDGQITPVEQDDALSTYAAKIQKQDAELDWSRSAEELHRHIRAYNPAPGAFFFANGDVRVKVWKASVVSDVNADAGTFTRFDRDGIVVACGKGGLSLTSLQVPGKRRASVQEFVKQIDLL